MFEYLDENSICMAVVKLQAFATRFDSTEFIGRPLVIKVGHISWTLFLYCYQQIEWPLKAAANGINRLIAEYMKWTFIQLKFADDSYW